MEEEQLGLITTLVFSSTIGREEEEQSSEEEEEVGGRELPSVKSDKTLAGIAAKVKIIDFSSVQ